MTTSTPFYTFPGTSHVIDVRAVTSIRPCIDSGRVFGTVDGEPLDVDVDGVADPAAVVAEVVALMREHFMPPTALADYGAQARIIGSEAGKAIGEALERALGRAFDTEPSSRSLAVYAASVVKGGIDRIALEVGSALRSKS